MNRQTANGKRQTANGKRANGKRQWADAGIRWLKTQTVAPDYQPSDAFADAVKNGKRQTANGKRQTADAGIRWLKTKTVAPDCQPSDAFLEFIKKRQTAGAAIGHLRRLYKTHKKSQTETMLCKDA